MSIRGGITPEVLLCFALLLIIYLAGKPRLADAQAPELTAEQVEILQEEAQEQEKPSPPEEEPEEVPIEIPELWPIVISPVPATTLEVGPITGIMAPYGYPAALDTLTRGWRFHRLGPVRLTPFFEYNTIYRSNIYQTYAAKKADWIHNLNPGLKLELPLAHRHLISLGYLGDYFIFSHNDQDSHYDHNLNADAAINLRGGLSLRFGSTYRSATEERTTTTGRQRRYERLGPNFEIAYNRADLWRLQGNYQLDVLDFEDNIDQRDNRQDHTGGITLDYKFWPKTALLAQYIIQRREYPDAPRGNSLSHTPFLGLSWDPTAKLSGTIKFGYTMKEYDTGLPERDNHPSSWAMSIQTLYRYSRYTWLTLISQRSTREDLDFGNNAYDNTAFYVTWHHDWHYFKTESYLAFYYNNNSYLNATLEPVTGLAKQREDNIISLGGGLSRPFTPYMKFRLDYHYLTRDSNFNTYSYNEHRFLAGMEASF